MTCEKLMHTLLSFSHVDSNGLAKTNPVIPEKYTCQIHLRLIKEICSSDFLLCVCSFPRVWKKILNTNHLTVWNKSHIWWQQNALSVNVRLSAYFLQRLTGLSVHLLWRNVNTAAPQGDAKRSQVYRSV